MSKKLNKLSTNELFAGFSAEIINSVKNYRDGITSEIKKGKFAKELEKRGIEIQILESFIHRIYRGDFDNADGLEVSIVSAKEAGK